MSQNDRINREVLSKRLIRRLTHLPSLPTPATNLVLAGPWGCGKTTLLREVVDDQRIKDSYHIMWFSPWESLHDTDVRVAFLAALTEEWRRADPKSRNVTLNQLKRHSKPVFSMVSALAEPIIPGAGIFLKLLDKVGDSISTVADAEPSQESEVHKRRKQIAQLIKQILDGGNRDAGSCSSKRFLLIVDDLDRCRPEDAVKLLDMLYHLFMPGEQSDGEWPLSSIWAVNMPVLEEFLYREYRDLPSFDSLAYLEKIFHVRVNVPPMADVSGDAVLLWEKHFKGRGVVPAGLFQKLAEGLDYAVLGNLRLYGKLIDQCLDYWQHTYGSSWTSQSADGLVRDARLMTLVVAYPGFREYIALYPGMWPEFVNRRNAGNFYEPMKADNPAFRYLRDQSLLTLLRDLNVLQWDGARYISNDNSQDTLRKQLLEMLKRGF